MSKECTKCRKTKNKSEFFKDKKRSDGLRHWCKKCCNEANKKWYRSNYRSVKNTQLKSTYGVTLEFIEDMYDRQEGLCCICQSEVFINTTDKSLQGYIDHNHDTLEIRGILCTRCNTGLGMFKDSPDILEKAISYLKDKGNYAR